MNKATYQKVGDIPFNYMLATESQDTAPLPLEGRIYLEGPHYPERHRWYASCEARNGIIVKVS